MPRIAHVVLWMSRAAWLAVAIVGGTAIGEALSDEGRSVQLTGTVAAWAGWALGAIALAVPGVLTLTLARVTVPGSLVVVAVIIIDGIGADVAIALLAPALAASALVASAEFGRVYIQASAYGDERRFGLRAPIGYLLASTATWLVWTTALVITLPAFAARAWVLGLVSLAVAAAGLTLLPRRWHQLSRRWLVLVPAGLVVHDPVVLGDTLTLPRRTIAAVLLDDVGAARHHAADLTGPAPGLAMEIQLTEPTTAVLAPTRSHGELARLDVAALVVAPSRPGAAVRAILRAGYPGRP